MEHLQDHEYDGCDPASWSGAAVRRGFRQLGFATMVAVAVKPMMCYRHPNGLSSIVEYPDALCGEATHTSMLAFGVVARQKTRRACKTQVLLAFAFGFLATCAYAAYRLPSWSTSSSIEQVQAFRSSVACLCWSNCSNFGHSITLASKDSCQASFAWVVGGLASRC